MDKNRSFQIMTSATLCDMILFSLKVKRASSSDLVDWNEGRIIGMLSACAMLGFMDSDLYDMVQTEVLDMIK